MHIAPALRSCLLAVALGGSAGAAPPAAGEAPQVTCPFTSAPVLNGLSARIDAGGHAVLTWTKSRGDVVVQRSGSDGSKASFSVPGATTGYTDVTLTPLVASYVYAVQAVDCGGRSAVASASVQSPPLHLLVTYSGGSLSTPVCRNDCALTSLTIILSCGYPGFAPYLAGCDFSGTLFTAGKPISAANPLQVGGTACSSTAVMPIATASVAAIGGTVTRAGAGTPWRASMADRPTVQQLATPAGRSWGTTDLTGTLRLAAQCPPGTLP